MLLLVVPHALRVDAVLFAKGLGVAATFATFLVAARWARTEGRSMEDRRGMGAVSGGGADAGAWAAGAAAMGFAAIPATAVHAVSGMETALFTLLLTGLFASAADHVRGDARAGNRVIVLALLLGLTRPEGNLAAFVVIAVTAARLEGHARGVLALQRCASASALSGDKCRDAIAYWTTPNLGREARR